MNSTVQCALSTFCIARIDCSTCARVLKVLRAVAEFCLTQERESVCAGERLERRQVAVEARVEPQQRASEEARERLDELRDARDVVVARADEREQRLQRRQAQHSHARVLEPQCCTREGTLEAALRGDEVETVGESKLGRIYSVRKKMMSKRGI